MTTIPNVRISLTHELGSLTFSKQQLQWRIKRSSVTDANSTQEITINSEDIKNIEWMTSDKKHKLMSISFKDKTRSMVRFIGFLGEDEVEINNLCKANLGHSLVAKQVAVSGANWGKFMLRSQEMVFRTEDKVTFCTIPYYTISQAVIQSRNEISLEFKDEIYQGASNNQSKGEHLCELRMYIPNDEDDEPAHEQFYAELQKKAKLGHDNDNVIAWFKKVNFRVPRGKKEIKFLVDCFMFRTETYSYSIKYKQIKRLFVFDQPGDKVSFLVHLSPGIRQGYQTYGYLIMEFPADEMCKININATEEELRTVYASKDGKQVLNPVTEGETFDVLSRVFMALSKIKIIAARKFESAQGWKCVRCSYGPNSGLLYPLEKALFFMWKPVLYIRHADISSMNVLRMGESHNVRLFDIEIQLKKKDQKILFTGIDKSEYEHLLGYFLGKPNINIENKAFHQSRVNNNSMKTSSRGTRTRKHLKPSTVQFDTNEHESSDDDDDYDMDADASMLQEDDEIDQDYDNLVNGDVGGNDDDGGDMLVSDEEDDAKSNHQHKKKKHKKHKHKHKSKKHKSKKKRSSNASDATMH